METICFWRPRECAGRQIPVPTANVGDALRFGKNRLVRQQGFLGYGLLHHPSHRTPQPVQHGIFVGQDRMFGEQGQNAQGFSPGPATGIPQTTRAPIRGPRHDCECRIVLARRF